MKLFLILMHYLQKKRYFNRKKSEESGMLRMNTLLDRVAPLATIILRQVKFRL